MPADQADFKLLAGEYVLRLYAKKADTTASKELMSVRLQISEEQSKELQSYGAGIYFDWEPSQQAYLPLIEIRAPEIIPPFVFDLHE